MKSASGEHVLEALQASMGDLTERCAVRSHGGGGSGGDDGDEPTFVLERQERGGLGLGVVQVSGATLSHGNGGGGGTRRLQIRDIRTRARTTLPMAVGMRGERRASLQKQARVCALCGAMQ